MDFDNFLFTLVKKYTATDIYLNSSIADLAIEKNKVSIREKNTAATFEAKIIIGADGTHSILAKQLANRIIDRKHHVGSVRAYYLNVNNMESNTTEVYFDKKFLPSYLWIFPLPGNKANVGFGMLSSIIAKKKLNIKNAFYQFIQQNPELSLRFKDATQISKLEGFGLPLGSKRVKISGDNFILTGDAASLIDPFSGEGIGNAMLSAKLAAEQVARSFKANDFTGKYIEAYDKALFKILGREFKLRYKAQQLVSAAPFVLDTIFMASKNKIVKNLIQKNL
jgi:flavin-dependent dehydrogenase